MPLPTNSKDSDGDTVWHYTMRNVREPRGPYYCKILRYYTNAPKSLDTPETLGQLFTRIAKNQNEWEDRAERGDTKRVGWYRLMPVMELADDCDVKDMIYMPNRDWVNENGHLYTRRRWKQIPKKERVCTEEELEEALAEYNFPPKPWRKIYRGTGSGSGDDDECYEGDEGHESDFFTEGDFVKGEKRDVIPETLLKGKGKGKEKDIETVEDEDEDKESDGSREGSTSTPPVKSVEKGKKKERYFTFVNTSPEYYNRGESSGMNGKGKRKMIRMDDVVNDSFSGSDDDGEENDDDTEDGEEDYDSED